MSRLGIAIIGASARSTMMFGHLKKRPEDGFVTGAYDIIPERAKYILEHYEVPDAIVYDSLEQAVSDPRADAAFISTTDCAHAECSIAALRAGKHVFCEKPMALSVGECDAVMDAAKDARGIFYLGMNLRHGPVHETLHEILASGQLGKLLSIEANEYYHGGRTYFRRWNRLRKFGGGLWITKACHDFDLLNWMAGGGAKRVFATSSLSYFKPKPQAGTHCRQCSIASQCPDCLDVEVHKGWVTVGLAAITEQATGVPRDLCLYNSDKDTFDNAIAVVDYDNDVRATYTVNVVSPRNTRQMRLMGTDGAAEGDMQTGIVTVWPGHAKDKIVHDMTERMKSGHGGADAGIVADFLRCCRTGDKPRSSWQEGRASVQLGLAARQSCDTGKPVTIPD